MRISLFGNLRISFAGRPVTAVNTNRLQSLIAYLILHGDTPQPRERLAFMLWPASSESQAQLREGLDGMRRLGAEVRLPYYFTLLAETLGRAGLVGEALASLSTGFAFASKNGEEWAVAELHRAQGDLLAAEGKRESARVSFRKGLEAARRSGSLAFERKLSVLADGAA